MRLLAGVLLKVVAVLVACVWEILLLSSVVFAQMSIGSCCRATCAATVPLRRCREDHLAPRAGAFALGRPAWHNPCPACAQRGRLSAAAAAQVKFTATSWHEKLGKILEDFPKVDDVHPFYADLLNVLYDRDHYKLALGQLHMARSLIDKVAQGAPRLCHLVLVRRANSLEPMYKTLQLRYCVHLNTWSRVCAVIKARIKGCFCGVADYVRLLKYGDSLYRCKELKRAAMVSC